MLSDPRLFKPLNRIKRAIGRLEDLALNAETWNDPRTSTSSGRSASKPHSRPPAPRRCDWLVRRTADVLTKLAEAAEAAVREAAGHKAKARPADMPTNDEVESVGGRRVIKLGSTGHLIVTDADAASRGGDASAAALTPEQRSERASKAARARWKSDA